MPWSVHETHVWWRSSTDFEHGIVFLKCGCENFLVYGQFARSYDFPVGTIFLYVVFSDSIELLLGEIDTR